MALLDTYFAHLQAQTGAQYVLLVRDDPIQRTCTAPIQCTPPRSLGKKQRCRSWHPTLSSTASDDQDSLRGMRPAVQMKQQINRPPSPPLRIESQDDLCTLTIKRIHNRQELSRSPSGSNDRIQSLFGAEFASRIKKSMRSQNPSSSLQQSPKNVAPPLFPVRKGSGDNLCSLKSRATPLRMKTGFPPSMLNEKLELTEVLDRVDSVLGSVKKSLERTNARNSTRRYSDSIATPYSLQLSLDDEYGQHASLSPKSARWIARPSVESMEVRLASGMMRE